MPSVQSGRTASTATSRTTPCANTHALSMSIRSSTRLHGNLNTGTITGTTPPLEIFSARSPGTKGSTRTTPRTTSAAAPDSHDRAARRKVRTRALGPRRRRRDLESTRRRVHGVDLWRIAVEHHHPSHLDGRGEFTSLGIEITRKNLEFPDGLGSRHRLVGGVTAT